MTKHICSNCGNKVKKTPIYCPYCGAEIPEGKKDPNKCHTDISIILDRSGSMEIIKEATIQGFNTFIETQKKAKGTAAVSLYQFDNEYQVVYEDTDINVVPEMTAKTFVPRNTTALLDAIGITINTKKEIIKKMSEKPDTVIIVIITDGRENSSMEFNNEDIKQMIKERRDHKWEFVFLGANQDAIKVAEKIYIPKRSAMSYFTTPESTSELFNALGNSISYMRNTSASTDRVVSFSDTTRKLVGTSKKEKI